MLRTRSEGAVPILVALGVLLASAVAAWGDIGVITFSGREVFRGLFFGEGPAAPRLHDLRSAALRSGAERRAFWMSEEVTREAQRLRIALREGEGSVAWGEAPGSGSRFVGVLLAEIERQDPKFFDRFQGGMQSNDPALVEEAMRDGSVEFQRAMGTLGFGSTLSSELSASLGDLDLWQFLALATPEDAGPPACCKPGCANSGELQGQIFPPNFQPRYGLSVGFSAAATDAGGSEVVCIDNTPTTVPIPGEGVTYHWMMQSPDGSVSEGQGATAPTITMNRCGTWKVVFKVYPNRTKCPPQPIVLAKSVTFNGPVPCPTSELSLGQVLATIDAASDYCLSLMSPPGGPTVTKQALRQAALQRMGNNGEELLCRCDCNLGNCGQHNSNGLLGVCVTDDLQSYKPNSCQCPKEVTFIHELIHDVLGDEREPPICQLIANCFGCGTNQVCD
jgi:hypothetical protein